MREYTALWKGGLGAGTGDWLAEHGWRVRAFDATAMARSYGRPAPPESSGRFLTATLRGAG
jgi:hypothetical protein